MDWISKLERKIGKYAIQNLTIYLMVCYGIGFVLMHVAPQAYMYLMLEPMYILKGQIWRVITWVLIPPSSNILSFLIMLSFYYFIGTTLERTWGSFRYNLYLFMGIIFTVAGAFILYFVTGGYFGYVGFYFNTTYINLSLFLAFAVVYPEMEVLLMFIIPIKMKWLALVDAAYLAYYLITGTMEARVAIIASLLNFVIFFFSSKQMRKYAPKQMARKAKFQKQVKHVERQYPNGARHRCAVCGRTELDDPNLEFRYCSKCNGNYEYCQDHLFTHEHVK